nr:NADH dehydrogenase subunit 2 [Mastotermes darwiniensis]
MPNNSTKILLMITLLGGVLISVSANSWFGAWMGLEINLLSFIPLMSNINNIYTTEASLKYFLVQAMASSILLFLVMVMALADNLFSFEWSIYSSVAISTPLLLKMGAAPLHWWFPSVMEGLEWTECLLLMTVQKISPFILISYLLKMNLFLASIIMTSVAIGSIGGINQTSLRKILTYSSINHTGWMLSAMSLSESMWLLYFSIYSLLTTTVISIIKPFKPSFINQLMMMKKEMVITKFLMFTSLLSLGGLPPFLGFMPKWVIIQEMTANKHYFLITFMVMGSLLTLYYYLRICYSSFLILHTELKWNKQFSSNQFYTLCSSFLSFLSLTGLVLCTMFTGMI